MAGNNFSSSNSQFGLALGHVHYQLTDYDLYIKKKHDFVVAALKFVDRRPEDASNFIVILSL